MDARVIHQTFSRGRSVDREALRRVAHRYHGLTKGQIRRAIKRMSEFGIVHLLRYGSLQLLPTAADWLAQKQAEELVRMRRS